ncbi:hypothetical protein [Cellulomonas sp. ES6]|uniref:hypothetical protein n=1 Tax=Cellulomonas sp. ES6 TaxID=3039384 RepID=UPI0024B8011C|nr:hypothetical protein [Cellulomonas sp. ES6]WHP18232.1 hypothetical protein P9841_03435 [Cellulomonas sp. ES6]
MPGRLVTARQRSLPALFVVSRGGARPVVAAVATAALVVGWVPLGLRDVPLADGVALVTLGVCSVLPALCCLGSLVPPGRGVEATLPRGRLAGLRASWALALTVAVLGTGAAVGAVRGLDPDSTVLVLRSGLLGLGAMLVSAVLLPPAAAWLPLALFAMVSWLAGSRDLAGTARWWAVLSHHPGSTPAAGLALALWLAGVAAYSRWDARGR